MNWHVKFKLETGFTPEIQVIMNKAIGRVSTRNLEQHDNKYRIRTVALATGGIKLLFNAINDRV